MLCSHCKVEYEPSEPECKELGLKTARLFHPGGCPHCFGLGYKGRCGIYELLPITSSLKRQLLKSADAVELQRVALAEGMMSLRHAAALLAVQGLTSTSEVLRVTRGSEEECNAAVSV
jgi:type II secretory ATPase GspE/PulE/Tfp pilus assembly ATPase PilB-like protein